MAHLRGIVVFLLAVGLAASSQSHSAGKSSKLTKDTAPPPAEDISGMYSFLNPGEFLQINLEDDGVTGYLSRRGDLESDRGTLLDQFFEKASVQGHEVNFTTKVVHGEWFEFKGRFEHGRGKSKGQEGYYVLRGTLTEFSGDTETSSNTELPRNNAKDVSAHPHQVEFRLMAQPQEVEENKSRAKAR